MKLVKFFHIIDGLSALEEIWWHLLNICLLYNLQFRSWVYTQQKPVLTSANAHEQECSEQFYAYSQTGNNPKIHQHVNG